MPEEQKPAPQIVYVKHRKWNRRLAMLLSLVLPGLGQVYKGQMINGLAWFVATIVGYLAFIVPGLLLHILCILGAGRGDPHTWRPLQVSGLHTTNRIQPERHREYQKLG